VENILFLAPNASSPLTRRRHFCPSSECLPCTLGVFPPCRIPGKLMVTRTSQHQPPESPRANTNAQADILARVFFYLLDVSNMHNHAILWVPSVQCILTPSSRFLPPAAVSLCPPHLGSVFTPLFIPLFIFPFNLLCSPFLVYQLHFADSTYAPPLPPN
jgi:hypothetical protein